MATGTGILNQIIWEPRTHPLPEGDVENLLAREWLLTNGRGGYSSGTVSGVCTRRYHGLLVAALPAPQGRYLILNHLSEEVRLTDGRVIRLWAEERPGGQLDINGTSYLTEFRLESGLPVWRYEIGEICIEKRVVIPHLQNIVQVGYRLLSGPAVRIRLRPSFHFRPHESPVSEVFDSPYLFQAWEDRFEVRRESDGLYVRLLCLGPDSACILTGGRFRDIFYRLEARRGYESVGRLWSPGHFRATLQKKHPVTLVASAESWDVTLALKPGKVLRSELERREVLLQSAHPAARSGTAAELVYAADQFIIEPSTRSADAARIVASGTEARSVIAGYHWFTDWGRDTMISLEGLTLVTGRHAEAADILKTFAHYIREGLIPNLFPEGQNEGLYHTADATLWFFHALHRYVQTTGDRTILRQLLPRLVEVVEHHLRGTSFGIGVDQSDGLLRQGQEGYQLTWMDAKVDGWVVTPRRGKAVEINALWYNALRLTASWIEEIQGAGAARPLRDQAEETRRSFNRRFWYQEGGYLYDVVDGENGDDTALRPNQLLAVSLDYPVLDRSHWEALVSTVHRELLTPVGLRSLARNHSDYKSKYFGDLRARDAAYHQGTVWGWLIGPFIDAWLKVYPHERAGARKFLEGFEPHLQEACVGSISEVFDAEEPFTPRGCIAQAWSVAEVLRCWIITEP